MEDFSYFIIYFLSIACVVFFILFITRVGDGTKLKKAKHFIDFLYKNKRISADEYRAAMGHSPEEASRPAMPAPVMQPTAATHPVFAPQTAAMPAPLATVQPMPTPQPVPVSRPQTQPMPRPAPAAPKEKPFNAMNVLLIIGVLFVILAGVIFATTTWLYLGKILRAVTILSVSLVFFAASVLAEKGLKIRKTAIAFYTIGSAFLPVTVIAAGYLKLFGDYFALTGEGRFFLFLAAAVLLGGASLIGSVKYKFLYFTEAFLYCVTASVVFLAAGFHPKADLFIAILYAYVALIALLGNWIKGKDIRSDRFRHLILKIPLFAVINSLVIAAIGVLVVHNGVLSGASAVLVSPVFLAGLFRGKKSYACVIPFTVLITAGLLRLNTGSEYIHYMLLMVLASALIAAAGTLKLFPEAMKTWLRTTGGIVAGLIYLLQFVGMIDTGKWTLLQILVLAGLMTVLVYIGYAEKNKIYFGLSSVVAVTILTGIASMLASDRIPAGLLCSGMTALLFALLIVLDRFLTFSPRTVVSDFLFPIWCFFGSLADLFRIAEDFQYNSAGAAPYRIGALVSLLLLLMILVYLMLEKKWGAAGLAAPFAIPAVFMFLSVPVCISITGEKNIILVFLIFYIALAIGGLVAMAFRFFRKFFWGMQFSALFVMLMFGLPLAAILWIADTDMFYPAFFLVLTVYLFGRMFFGVRNPKFTRKSIMFLVLSLGTGASLYVTLSAVAYSWFSVRETFPLLLFPALGSALIFIAGALLKRFAGFVPSILEHLERTGSYGMMFFAPCLLLAFDQKQPTVISAVILLLILLSLFSKYLAGRAWASSWYEVILLYCLTGVLMSRVPSAVRNDASILAFSILFILLCTAGRILHREVFSSRMTHDGQTNRSLDWLTLTSSLSVLILVFLGETGFCIACILAAIYTMSFFGRVSGKSIEETLMTIAGPFLCMAFWVQPFVHIEPVIVSELNLLVFVGYFFLLDWFIWKRKPATGILLFLSACLSFFILGIQAIVSGDLVDALIIGLLSFVLLVVSFLLKTKKWFILSTLTLLILTIYMTRNFWASIAWWVYLLAVGLILIGLAAANEISKQRGTSLFGKTKNVFKEWK